MLFLPIFTKGIRAKLNELESESEIFPQNEGKVGKSELTPVVKALTNCAMFYHHYKRGAIDKKTYENNSHFDPKYMS